MKVNALHRFANMYGHVCGNEAQELLPKYKEAVKAVIGDKATVGEPWNDDYSNNYTDWQIQLKDIEGMAPSTEIVLTLCKDVTDMSSWLECYYGDDDCNEIASIQGDVGNFDPFPLIDYCLKKNKTEAKQSHRPCSMQKKIESLSKKNEARHIKPRSKEDLIAAVEKIREGWWTLSLGLGDFNAGPFGDMLEDIFNCDSIVGIRPGVWGASFDDVPMDDWADTFIQKIKDYKE